MPDLVTGAFPRVLHLPMSWLLVVVVAEDVVGVLEFLQEMRVAVAVAVA